MVDRIVTIIEAIAHALDRLATANEVSNAIWRERLSWDRERLTAYDAETRSMNEAQRERDRRQTEAIERHAAAVARQTADSEPAL